MVTFSRTFTAADQDAFAALSGDFNPMHVDPLAARRLMFGRCVVHGVRLVLWSLEQALQNGPDRVALTHLDASFRKPAGVGDDVTGTITFPTSDSAHIELSSGDQKLALIRCSWQSGDEPADVSLPIAERSTAREWRDDELNAAAGRVALSSPAIPLSQRLPPIQIATLLATTRLVGMECPGLHSVYANLDLNFAANSLTEPTLGYRVTKWDPRFRRLTMELEAPDATGRIVAFVRHPPQSQPTCAELAGRVAADAFFNQRALVIGGSRGIGEATAKLLAAGGANVWLTYHRGAKDAEAVVADITSAGYHAEALPCDASDPDWPVMEAIRPTHLYYFATPPIFSGSDAPAFTQFYVTAFGALVDKLVPHGLTHALYPSSVAVDSAPAGMEDYAAAKAAGEELCRTLEKNHPGLTILAPRLPRLATDQTATFALVEAGSPADIMLPLLHQLTSP